MFIVAYSFLYNYYTKTITFIITCIQRFASTTYEMILVSNLECNASNPKHLTLYHCPRTSGTSCTHNQDIALNCSSPYSRGINFSVSKINNDVLSTGLS